MIIRIYFFKTLVIRHLGYSKKSMTSQPSNIIFLKKQLANMSNVKIHLDLYACTSYVTCEGFMKMLLGFKGFNYSKLSSLSYSDVIKIDLIIKQDGGRLVSFVLQFKIQLTI